MPKLKGIYAKRRKLVHKKGAYLKSKEARRLRQEEKQGNAALKEYDGDSLEDRLLKTNEMLRSFGKDHTEIGIECASLHSPVKEAVPNTTILISRLKSHIKRVKRLSRSTPCASKSPESVLKEPRVDATRSPDKQHKDGESNVPEEWTDSSELPP